MGHDEAGESKGTDTSGGGPLRRFCLLSCRQVHPPEGFETGPVTSPGKLDHPVDDETPEQVPLGLSTRGRKGTRLG